MDIDVDRAGPLTYRLEPSYLPTVASNAGKEAAAGTDAQGVVRTQQSTTRRMFWSCL